VTADLDPSAEIGGAPLDHTPSIDPVHRPFRQSVGAACSGAEEGGLTGIAPPDISKIKAAVDSSAKDL
jgi:hypothetical protein